MSAVLHLEAELNIYSAGALKQRLLDAFDVTPNLTLDVSSVCEADSAGVQLLIAASRHAAAAGGLLTLEGRSDALFDALGLLGLDAQLANLTRELP